MPQFSKTRLIYYHNKPSNLTSSNIDTKVTVNNVNPTSMNMNMRICTVKGDDHNWHNVPLELYGLYVTEAEFGSLFDMYDRFWPTDIKCTLGHTIPIAKYAGTTNSTQLSFNNTIYSLTYCLTDTDNVTCVNSFNDLDVLYDLFRTFDGVSFNNGSRIVLPLADILYKIPYQITPTAGGVPEYDETPQYTTLDRATTTTGPYVANALNVDPLSTSIPLNELKENFYPDFLQDNTNIKALYPGENIDQVTWHAENNGLAGVDCAGYRMNKIYHEQDHRAYGISSNTIMDFKYLMGQIMFPRARGPQVIDGFNQGINIPNIQQFHHHNITEGDFYANGPPKFFIKGVPIVDDSDALVNHQFLCTITWELTIEGEPRKSAIPRPLRWGFMHYDVIQTVVKDPTGNLTYKTRQVPTKTWPKKPYHDGPWQNQVHLDRFVNTTTGTNPYYNPEINCYPPWTISTTNTARSANTILNEEFDANRWKRNANYFVPTKSFYTGKNPPAYEGPMTRAKKKQQESDQTVPPNIDVEFEIL